LPQSQRNNSTDLKILVFRLGIAFESNMVNAIAVNASPITTRTFGRPLSTRFFATLLTHS
jgi:hypothetical protein